MPARLVSIVKSIITSPITTLIVGFVAGFASFVTGVISLEQILQTRNPELTYNLYKEVSSEGVGEGALRVKVPRKWIAQNTGRRLHFWNEDIGPNLAVARFSTAKWYGEGSWGESGLSFGASKALLNLTEAEIDDLNCHYERIDDPVGSTCEYQTELFGAEDEKASKSTLDQGITTALSTPPQDGDEEAAASKVFMWMTTAGSACDQVANERVWPTEDHEITYSAWTNCTDADTDFITFLARPKKPEDEQEKYIAYGAITIVRDGDWEVVDRLFDSIEVEPRKIF
jgi:hypothetical protein